MDSDVEEFLSERRKLIEAFEETAKNSNSRTDLVNAVDAMHRLKSEMDALASKCTQIGSLAGDVKEKAAEKLRDLT